jgi:hypothetical protein
VGRSKKFQTSRLDGVVQSAGREALPATPVAGVLPNFGVRVNMKRPQLISPGSLNRMLQTANEAWERCDFQQCFELLGKAAAVKVGRVTSAVAWLWRDRPCAPARALVAAGKRTARPTCPDLSISM